jgi:exopolyphosphatase/guanosine-5'-triphosphate,3'-diphosphate pyrophosphatase
MSKFAVIDLGSSTIKLTVANVINADISVIKSDRCSKFPLGEDIAQIGELRQETIYHNAQLIKGWQQELKKYDIIATRLVSTGAARRAPNKQRLIDILKKETGLSLEIIQGEDEAKIIFYAISSDFPDNSQPLAVLNVGGGSSELILGSSKEGIDTLYSFDNLGVRGLRQFLKSDPPSGAEHSILIDTIGSIPTDIDT